MPSDAQEMPLISCLCITKNRPLLLQRAITCFERQVYPKKELVISYPEGDLLTKRVIDQVIFISDIKILAIERPKNENLGASRNHAIMAASGEFICIWDDDDWYSNHRISAQYEAIRDSEFKACIYTNIVIYHFKDQKSCISDFRLWEGTLLCAKEILPEHPYLEKENGEAETILKALSASGKLFPIVNDPYLYVYIFHGLNILETHQLDIHFKNNASLEESVNQNIIELTSLDNYLL
ncbi:glycosyltransferase [Pedobacter sp. FW305-3-2-15-E-R2A2]|uniref:glycosyltransferase family 2 protein n=1 Tax=Pedobacter sp. FW305-3-2-15-E-R2A2 TaxID=3140251 RepID=UPI00313FE0A5